MTTEGIIQKAFRRYKTYGQPNTINQLEHELIAEIKKQHNTWMGNISRREIDLFTKELIGDKQE